MDIVITGSSVSGSGFFDPGSGFTNHIGAAISGVTVNSVTYTDPTHITLNISTVGSSPGSFDVTVTNPDGQSATGTSILSVTTACPVIGVSPAAIPDATYNAPYSQIFSASGGTGSFTFGLTGSLPTGVSFAGPTLSGTPLQVGSFPITVTATDAEGCPGSQDYTLTVTTVTAAVEINGSGSFQSIQAAYDNPVADGDVIQAQAIDFVESPVFGNPVSITLSGGYDPTFTSNLSSYTKIMGSLTISAGTVTIENVIIH